MNSKKSDTKQPPSNSFVGYQTDYQKKLNQLTTIQTSSIQFLKSRIKFIISFTILIIITITLYINNQHHSISTKFNNKQASKQPIINPFNTPPKPKKLNPSDYSDEKLLSLPILITTSNEPFNPINDHKPLPNHLKPFTTEKLNTLLKTPPKSNPPKLYPYPSHPSTSPKPTKVQNTTIKDYDLASKSKLPTSSNPNHLKSVQYLGFKKTKFIQTHWETKADENVRKTRKEWVKNAFLVTWEGYKAKAWGHDELKPISGSFDDPFSGWGATLVDCLDTLLIMDLPTEYEYARDHVRSIDWSKTLNMQTIKSTKSPARLDPTIAFFETVIRYLGGLISAYELSNDRLMLQRAEDLADWLIPAFGTDLGYPMPHYQLGSNPEGRSVGRVCLAEMGSLLLEFTRLSQLTQKPQYFYYVQRITDHLDSPQWKSENRIGSLFPTFIDPHYPESLYGDYTFGGMADSYYEYLIKQYQLLGLQSPQYAKMYSSTLDSAKEDLINTFQLEPTNSSQTNIKPKTITVIGDKSGGKHAQLVRSLDHLTCFSGAMIGLGARLLDRVEDLDLAVSHTDSCVWAYESTRTGLAPERMSVFDDEKSAKYWEAVEYNGEVYRRLMRENGPPGSVTHDSRYLGRPETIESVFYMWRITGDKVWQDRGWRMFTSWVEGCLTEFGFADIIDVNRLPYQRSDKQESFVLAETLKYYYLLFDDPNLISLDEFVFNTEAHPFKLGRREALRKYEWKKVEDDSVGGGSVLQAWAGVKFEELDVKEKEIYGMVIGL